ncbi:MAG: OmpH family outer membrane protein, partial [Proteobacteria bacterium]|nr:OmpH family outer membrane protein [Pseudomonadota bacterium]
SDEVRAEKEREYQKRLRDYGLKTEDAKLEMQQLEKKHMEPILKQLHDIIADVGKKNGYSIILENTMKGLRNRTGLLYADDTLDISDQVQKELDTRLKK